MADYNSHAAAPHETRHGVLQRALRKTRSTTPKNSVQEPRRGACQDPEKTPQGAERNGVEP